MLWAIASPEVEDICPPGRDHTGYDRAADRGRFRLMATGAPEFKPTDNPASFADSLLTRVSFKKNNTSIGSLYVL